MNRLLLFVVPIALIAGQTRYARLGEMDGKVEVQLQAADPWSPAERNLPLTQSAWLRTGAASRLEIELDEGSAVRLGPDSLLELSDYTRLSTGQRVTVLSLDRGVAYFTGEAEGKDALTLAVPGAQIVLSRGARVRLESAGDFSRIAVIEGVVRFSCPTAELDLHEGNTVRVDHGATSSFGLDRGVAPMALDPWSEDRDKILATPISATHVAMRYGLADLDSAGEWMQSDIGAVWKPRVAEGWAPFQKGRWRWYDALGYTWVSDESWGWLPYHYGRWTRKNDLGWVWAPAASGASPIFKPGDVYWLWGRQLAGWGPLAHGEEWSPSAAPQQFNNANTTYAAFALDYRVIDPAGFTDRPKEPLGAAVFALALPSPAFPASRLEARRPALRVGATKAIGPDSAYQEVSDIPPPAPLEPPAVVTNPASGAPPNVQPGDPGPPGPPMQVMYPVPPIAGIIVLNPPEHPDYSRRNGNGGNGSNGGSGQPAQTPQVRGNPSGGARPPSSVTPPAQPTGVPKPVPTASAPVIQIPQPKIITPSVGVSAPTHTDRPTVQGIPVRRDPPPEQRREPPKEAAPVAKPEPQKVEAKPMPKVEQPKAEAKDAPPQQRKQ